MDPNATLALLRAALAAGDVDDAREAFDALDEWITKGGFLPAHWAPWPALTTTVHHRDGCGLDGRTDEHTHDASAWRAYIDSEAN